MFCASCHLAAEPEVRNAKGFVKALCEASSRCFSTICCSACVRPLRQARSMRQRWQLSNTRAQLPRVSLQWAVRPHPSERNHFSPERNRFSPITFMPVLVFIHTSSFASASCLSAWIRWYMARNACAGKPRVSAQTRHTSCGSSQHVGCILVSRALGAL